jgi:1-deoxy-D-xylulose 5-phosphate reductoisomerase
VEIPKVIEKVLNKHRVIKNPNLQEIFQIDEWARIEALR